jgi:hypothetical protein
MRELGRSHGGLTTKVHLACDGMGQPLSIVITPGYRQNILHARSLSRRGEV